MDGLHPNIICHVVGGIGFASAFGLVGVIHGRMEHPHLRVEHPQERHGNERTNVELLRRVGYRKAEQTVDEIRMAVHQYGRTERTDDDTDHDEVTQCNQDFSLSRF